MPKRKYSKKKRKPTKKKIKILNLILLMVFISITASIIAYTILLQKTNITTQTNSNTKHINTQLQDKKELEQYRQERLEKYQQQLQLNTILNTEEISDNNIIKEIKEKLKNNQTTGFVTIEEKDYLTVIKKENLIKKEKPQLVIIIDDVSSSFQVKDILALKHHITMSFLPPTAAHANSALIAKPLDFFMIHIPLEAKSTFKFQEKDTLNMNDSYETIENYIQKIRQWYPKGLYINNHTGSQFTANDVAMDKLYKALKKHHFIFVDSRTTSKSLAKKYSLKYQMPFIARNIFLDNEQNFSYIQNQLKKAINIAKRKGSAIAIGHPYPITIKVLKESEHLFKDVELVYLNESLKK